MSLYENIFIARQDISGAQVDALADTFTQLVTDNGGDVKKREYWGLRHLAYRVRKNRKGHYVLLNIDAPPAAIAGGAAPASGNGSAKGVRGLPNGPPALNEPTARSRNRWRRKWRVNRQAGPREWRRRAARSSGVGNPARFRVRTHQRSTIRIPSCYNASSPSAARSCRAGSPPSRPRSSASSLRLSSVRGSSACSPTW